MSRIAIVGVGISKFGARADIPLRELAFEAFSEKHKPVFKGK